MKHINLTALFLLLCILSGTFIACVEPDARIIAGADSDTAAAQTDEDGYESVIAGFERNDYGGYQFTIIDRSELYDAYWATYDIFSEGLNGDPINDSVYERNSILEEMYNITILEKPDGAPAATAQKAIMAGEDVYDTVTDGLAQLGSLAGENLTIDYNKIPDIDLSNEWWDQAMIEELSVLDRLYFITGDISVMDNEGTWCVLFNKNLAEEYNVGDLYALVDDGKWTIERMHQTASDVAADLDGDGVMTIDDRWGLLTEAFNTYGFWVGGGDKIADKDENDIPFVTMYNDHSVSMLEKVLALQFDTETTFPSSKAPGYAAFSDVFSQGNAMYLYCSMLMITNFRTSDTDFGILPAAKYDETQNRYYNTYSFVNLTAYSIPVVAGDTSRTGVILETMAAISKYKLTPGYYHVSLKGKFIRDNESEKMLDLILATRNYDIGSVLNSGGALDMLMSAGNSFDFASAYAKKEEQIAAGLEKFVGSIQAN
ncbi:MAG: hypothetical protein PHZ09_13970 [Eubacteriales bacterium]|nr:hypothetical protein [Eubacteriales bacterium]